jgi:HAD superfamily hydrolase (TIGR01509 family)
MKYGYIFDFDGVLVKTMEAHFACNEQALAEEGVPIDKAQFLFQAGMTGREQIAYFVAKARSTADIEKIYNRKKELYEKYIDRVEIIECNLLMLKVLRDAGFPVAIATGSSRKSLDPVMKRFPIEVDAVVTSADIKRGKPNPDLFLLAAARLGLPPENCIVIEDSDVGILSAQNAGMRAMRFYDIKPGDQAFR